VPWLAGRPHGRANAMAPSEVPEAGSPWSTERATPVSSPWRSRRPTQPTLSSAQGPRTL